MSQTTTHADEDSTTTTVHSPTDGNRTEEIAPRNTDRGRNQDASGMSTRLVPGVYSPCPSTVTGESPLERSVSDRSMPSQIASPFLSPISHGRRESRDGTSTGALLTRETSESASQTAYTPDPTSDIVSYRRLKPSTSCTCRCTCSASSGNDETPISRLRSLDENSSSKPLDPSALAETALPHVTSVDALSVLKATASFSTEKDQKRLLKRLMRIVLETAGATRGVLVLEDPKKKDWTVEIAASIAEEDIIPSPHTSPLPSPILDETQNITVQPPPVPSPSALPATATASGASSENVTPILPIRHHFLSPSYSDGAASPVHRCNSASSVSSTLSNGTVLRMGEGVTTLAVESVLPGSIFEYAVEAKESVLLSLGSDTSGSTFKNPSSAPSPSNSPPPFIQSGSWKSDPYFVTHHPKAILCVPILRGGEVNGVVYLESSDDPTAFTSSHISLIQLLCSQAALSISNTRLLAQLEANNADLEGLIRQRTIELELKNSQLQQSKEEAEKLTKIKAEFLSNMSHEIRTPMNAVIGVSRLLADTNLSLEQQQYVSMITNSGHLLLTIINDILDYSKIEAGQLKLNLQVHNISDVIETAVMLVYDMAHSKGLYLSWFIDPTIPPQLMLDSTRIQQILLNLLSNAIKFTKTGGVDLVVTSRPIHSSESRPGSPTSAAPAHEIELQVRDTGIGISSTQLAGLFQSFSQVHQSQDFGSGTGLGLVISRRLVQAFHGEIQVESALGAGSTFTALIHASVAPSPVQQPITTLTAPVSSSLSSSGTRQSSSLLALHPTLRKQQMHGLDPLELQLLSMSRLLFICESSPSTASWMRLVECYGSTVQHCTSIQEAAKYLSRCAPPVGATTTSPRIPSAVSPMIPSSVTNHATNTSHHTSSHVLLPSISGIVVDLDAPDVTEEATVEQLCAFGPLRLLFLYSRVHACLPLESFNELRMADQLAVSGSDTNIVSMHTYGSSAAHLLLAAQRGDSLSPINLPVGAAPMDSRQMSGASVTCGTSSASASNSAGVTIAHSSGGISASASLPPQQVLSRHASANSDLISSHGIRRSIRKPWRARAFLAALVSVLSSSLTSASPSSALSRESSHPDSANSSISSRATSAGPLTDSGQVLSRLASSAPREKIPNIARAFPLRIMLAEDNLINQKMMVMLLRKLGYEIEIANNGVEALNILEREASKGRHHEIEVILMDASMDVMDGMECTRVIRAQQFSNRIRPYIIAQTANVSEEYRQRCLDSGMDMFISKPISVADLTAALKQAFSVQQAAAAARTPTTTTPMSPASGSEQATSMTPASSPSSAAVSGNATSLPNAPPSLHRP